MRQASKRIPESAEKTVRDIRRATRRHHSAEEKIRKACVARTALLWEFHPEPLTEPDLSLSTYPARTTA